MKVTRCGFGLGVAHDDVLMHPHEVRKELDDFAGF
jgi:hypothetical protein